MSALNREDNFAGRVAYAAATIAAGRRTTRSFDNCFENWDGDEVAVAVYRRSMKNPKIAANLFRYLGRDSVMEAVARFADVPTRDLPKRAAETRARRREKAAKELAEWDAAAEAANA